MLSYEKPVIGVLLAAFLVCALAGVALAADPEESGTRLDWYPVTQGVILWEGEERGLFDDLARELVVLLGKTQRGDYTTCEAPILPDETITLFHPGSSVRYHLILEGVDAPRLFRETRAGWKTASLSATFDSRYQSDFDAYQRWARWSEDLSALLEPDAADELYALRTEARNDLDAYKTILDALGLEEVIGPYSLTYHRESWVDNVTIVIENLPQTRQERLWMDGFLRSRGKLFLALATDPDHLSWYYPDHVGSRTERKLLPYTEELGQDSRQISQRDFVYLYAQRRLWWWDALASPNTVTVNGSVPVIYHPAYYIADVLYTNDAVGDDALYLGLTDLNPGYSEYIFREDYLYESLNKNKGGHGVSVDEYRPLNDYTVSDPVYHPENLLAGQTVLAAWEADPGYRIYQTETGLYLARWQPTNMDLPEEYLMYCFRLEEKPVSDDRHWPVPEDFPEDWPLEP